MTDPFNFETNGVVDNLDAVPEKYHGLYVEGADDNAGKHVLSPTVAGLVSDYTGLTKNLAGVRQEKKSASDESAERRVALAGINDTITALGVEIGDEGIIPAIEAFVTDLQDKVKGGAQMKIDLDKIKGQFDKQLAEVVAGKDADIAERDGALSKHLISGAAAIALAKHKGAPDLLLPHVLSQCEMVREDNGDRGVRVKDADGSHRMNGTGGWMNVDELVVEMKTKDAFARAFESEVKGGNDSKPGSFQRPAQRQAAERTPTEKIRDGLAKGQHTRGQSA